MHRVFGRFEESHNLRKFQAISHDDQIDIAPGALLAACDRTEYERDGHPFL